jgi:hypothetical protein
MVELGEDLTMQECRDHLAKALKSAATTETKRTMAADQYTKYHEQALKNHQKWRESLQDGLKKLTSQTPAEEHHGDDGQGTSSELL